MEESLLDSFLRYPLEEVPFVLLVLMIAFSVHEFAHAYTAHKFGDSTPKQMGRLTLNPRVHLDVLGTILFLIFGFGWAKPVLVNTANFKNRKWMSIAVSAAGPFSNLVLAFIGVLAIYWFNRLGYYQTYTQSGVLNAVIVFISYFCSLNIFLFIFNLIPIPPLDGYRILFDFVPLQAKMKLKQYEQWMFFVFILMALVPQLYRITLGPLLAFSNDILVFFMFICRTIFG
jgi:Zn-dependent protease